MITPEQLREWAQEADDGEDVALDGETLRGIAGMLEDAERVTGHTYEWPERD